MGFRTLLLNMTLPFMPNMTSCFVQKNYIIRIKIRFSTCLFKNLSLFLKKTTHLKNDSFSFEDNTSYSYNILIKLTGMSLVLFLLLH